MHYSNVYLNQNLVSLCCEERSSDIHWSTSRAYHSRGPKLLQVLDSLESRSILC